MKTATSGSSVPPSSETIRDGKFVELTYKVTDRKSGHVLTRVEFPLGYVHGHNEILAPSVHKALEGKCTGDVIEVPIDGNRIFGPRDESLVFTDRIENVPEDYRQVGTSILMENDQGQTRGFLVTRVTDETLTVDGNNPLCGREVVFTLAILTVRDATDEETRAGGAIVAGADIDPSILRPVSLHGKLEVTYERGKKTRRQSS
jgi:FKBP-type peptidyl-prolyl cis-trans isomerase SlyD